jgi:hypothetical protein
MTTTYKATDETRRVRDTTFVGLPVVRYRDELVITHAVASVDGVVASVTVCGVGVSGNPYRDFGTTFIGTRCAKCTHALDLGHLGS